MRRGPAQRWNLVVLFLGAMLAVGMPSAVHGAKPELTGKFELLKDEASTHQPGKVKIIARYRAYHGVTLATMSATGLPMYWEMFEPRVPGFVHVAAPYPYRFDGEVKAGESIG